jgi:cytochrome b561
MFNTFGKDYNCEETLKEYARWWAKLAWIVLLVLLIGGVLTGLLMAVLGDDVVRVIGILVLIGAPLNGLLFNRLLIFWAHKLWGYAEIVGNSARLAKGTHGNNADDDTLPEL